MNTSLWPSAITSLQVAFSITDKGLPTVFIFKKILGEYYCIVHENEKAI